MRLIFIFILLLNFLNLSSMEKEGLGGSNFQGFLEQTDKKKQKENDLLKIIGNVSFTFTAIESLIKKKIVESPRNNAKDAVLNLQAGKNEILCQMIHKELHHLKDQLPHIIEQFEREYVPQRNSAPAKLISSEEK